MKELIESIAKALVDDPSSVAVDQVDGDHSCLLKLTVAPSDLGKIIGKRGANANAIRTILDAAGGKAQRRFILEILE